MKKHKLYSVHSDHLNTPRMLSDENGTLVWTWFADAFGTEFKGGYGLDAPDPDPDGNGQKVWYQLRFPGQYKSYNYFRDINRSTGRYLQSDPIGLAGGLNTYAYVRGNPVRYTDPTGLLFLVHRNELSRDPIPRQDAIRISNFTNRVALTAAAATLGPTTAVASPTAARFAFTQSQLIIVRNPVLLEQSLVIGTAAAIPGPPDLSRPSSVIGFFAAYSPRDVAQTIVGNILTLHESARNALADFLVDLDQRLKGCTE